MAVQGQPQGSHGADGALSYPVHTEAKSGFEGVAAKIFNTIIFSSITHTKDHVPHVSMDSQARSTHHPRGGGGGSVSEPWAQTAGCSPASPPTCSNLQLPTVCPSAIRPLLTASAPGDARTVERNVCPASSPGSGGP